MVRSSLLSVAPRVRVGALLLLLAIVVLPQRAAAGGTEFPADGTRSLGRGGASMARADDPYVMIRNPARLADLWDDQAMIGAHFLLADSCFRPSGSYGIGTARMGTSAINVGGQTYWLNAPAGATDPDGQPLKSFQEEGYPEVCFDGPMPFLPHVALSMKLAPDLGVGLGFFPPDNASLNQWGNRDGTVDTPNGLRPNPLRYYRSHLNTSYFSALGAIGYRFADWIRVGFGFQWQMVVFQARNWTAATRNLNPINDVKVDIFGRDLFIPGLIGSVHLKPFDALDIVLGGKWSDLVQSRAKLDLTSGAWGTGVPPDFQIDGVPSTEGLTALPVTSHNQTGDVRSGPIWVPQLSFGLRYADRLKPLVRDDDWAKAKAASKTTEDSMSNERWDIELDVIWYLTSMFDYTEFTNRDATIQLYTIDGVMREPRGFETSVGDCTETVPGENGMPRCVERNVRNPMRGKNQLTARLGGDYNVLPGVLALRAGVSYEDDGQDPKSLNPTQYMFGRIGMHGGFTVRFAEKTDFTFGFAHFIQRDLRLQVGGEGLIDYQRLYQRAQMNGIDPAAAYNLETGSGFGVGENAAAMAAQKGPFDGVSGVEVPNAGQIPEGPYFINAGTFFYNLSVLSVELTQRF